MGTFSTIEFLILRKDGKKHAEHDVFVFCLFLLSHKYKAQSKTAQVPLRTQGYRRRMCITARGRKILRCLTARSRRMCITAKDVM